MILYGSTMSPFVRKVAAYAAEKGIELDLQPTGFPNPDAGIPGRQPVREDAGAGRWRLSASPIPARSSTISRPNFPSPS